MYVRKEGHEVLVLVNAVLAHTCLHLVLEMDQVLDHNLPVAQHTDRHSQANNTDLENRGLGRRIYLGKLTECRGI